MFMNANLICLLLGSCDNDKIDATISETHVLPSQVATRAAYDNNFDWENSSTVTLVGMKETTHGVPLPWTIGSPWAAIPDGWIDTKDIESTEYSERMYTRENNWELIYSNVSTPTDYKYIILYNKMTGILRCFCFVFAEVNTGTTDCAWGIGINGPTSLFNFTHQIAKIISDKDDYPTYITTPEGPWGKIGYNTQCWYGFEIECAYDPTLNSSNAYMVLLGKAINKSEYRGFGSTMGNINGTVTSTNNNNSSLNLSFSQMFNSNNSRSITLNNNSAMDVISSEIEKGVKDNDSFFTSLWGNIKKNASKWITTGLQSGVKEGIKAITSSGASAIAGSLSNVLSSIAGGGSKPTTSYVDLKIQLSSEYIFTSEQTLGGWANMGMSLNRQHSSLYNEPLGVWNIENTPIINLSIIHMIPRNIGPINKDIPPKTKAIYECINPSLIINPNVKKNYEISNLTCRYIMHESICLDYTDNIASDLEPVLINGQKYYTGSNNNTIIIKEYWLNYSSWTTSLPSHIVEVKFTLTNKNDPNDKYYYKKYFNATLKVISERTMRL